MPGACAPSTSVGIPRSSSAATILPVETLVRELAARGIDTLVDGAHAPGMLPLDLDRLGAAWYTGNLLKWVCAPKGAAFLHARRDRQPGIRPNTISHGANAELGVPSGDGGTSRYRAEFDWQGTLDPTPWLAVGDALRFIGGLVAGGWPAVMARNQELTLQARPVLADAVEADPAALAPASMLGSMFALPLPGSGPLALAGAGSSPLDTDPLQRVLVERFGIEVPIYPWPVPAAEPPEPPRRLIRVSSALHNDAADTERLADALRTLAREG